MTKGTKKTKKIEISLEATKKDNELGKYFAIWVSITLGNKTGVLKSFYTRLGEDYINEYLESISEEIRYQVTGILFWEDSSLWRRIPSKDELLKFITEFIFSLDVDNYTGIPIISILSK